MEIKIQLTTSPIAETIPPPTEGATGAWVEFRGVVRGEENGQSILALEYEAYPEMAEREIRRLLETLAVKLPCLAAQIIHRVGVIPVGETAIYIGVAARHRGPALALLAEFMDRLKQDVPIWKRRGIEAAQASCRCENDFETHRQDAIVATAKSSPGSHEVLARLREICQPLPPERVSLAAAAGRILREPVCATEDQPAFDRSAMDGYAVRLDDAAKQFRIVDEIRAGDWNPRQLQAGEAVRIATGGALPGDGLQVVMREDVQVEGATLTVLRRDDERHLRFRGDDARAGEVLVEAGTMLSPGALALLASVGAAQPLVTRLLRVLHLATGNEIVPPDKIPQRGQIRDSNSTLIRAFLNQCGIAPEQLRVPEDEAAVLSAISYGQSAIDLLLISGGASVGEHDFTRKALEQAGFTIHIRKTATRPGKPLIVAQRGQTLAFGLPGNPLAHFVCLNLYVRAAVELLAGRDPTPLFQTGRLAAELPAGGNARETFWPARCDWRNEVPTLTPLRWNSSGDLTALATANALIRVTAGAEKLLRGRRVEFISTDINA